MVAFVVLLLTLAGALAGVWAGTAGLGGLFVLVEAALILSFLGCLLTPPKRPWVASYLPVVVMFMATFAYDAYMGNELALKASVYLTLGLFTFVPALVSRFFTLHGIRAVRASDERDGNSSTHNASND